MSELVAGRTKGEQSWGTPQSLFDELYREFFFTLDVCASEWNTKLPLYFSEQENGLLRSWAGERCFCNPPFKQIRKWLEKGLLEVATNLVPSVFLLPANVGTRWFHEIALPFGEVHLFKGRIAFDAPPGQVDLKRPSFSPMLVILDPESTTFGVTKTRCAKTGRVL